MRKLWDALKATWGYYRLVTVNKECKWANLCLQQTGQAIGRHSLTLEALLGTGTARLAGAPSINPFWNNIFTSLDKSTFQYYSNTPSSTGELLLYGNKCFLEEGEPLDRRYYHLNITTKYNEVSDFPNVATEKPLQKGDPENGNMSPWEFADWEKLRRSVNSFYTTSPGAS